MNDAVADRSDFAGVERSNHPLQRRRRFGRLDDAGLELATTGVVEEGELKGARAGVDSEDRQGDSFSVAPVPVGDRPSRRRSAGESAVFFTTVRSALTVSSTLSPCGELA